MARGQNRKRVKTLWVVLAVLIIIAFMLSIIAPLIWAKPVSAETTAKVYVVTINNTIDSGLVKYIQRAYTEAEKAQASWVVLELDTLGGRIDSAMEIRDIIMSSRVPTAAYVTHRAFSAGALLTLASQKIYMHPASLIGAAEAVVLTPEGQQPADEKTLSAWRQEMATTARVNGRDPQLAEAMVDAAVEIPGVVEAGKLLTLGAEQAQQLGLADALTPSLSAVIDQLGMSGAEMIDFEISPAEKFAQWLTQPWVSAILLIIGIGCLVLELFTMGWGVAGSIGITSLLLFFGSSLIAGLAGWETIILFMVGLILILVEILVIPGFGIAGISGIIAMIASIFLAIPTPEQALISISLAIMGSIVFVLIGIRLFGSRKFWSRLILRDQQINQEGYQAPSLQLEDYLGQEGISLTLLRPSGTIEINGKRLDAVTEGEFVSAGVPVRVILVEGTRIVVRPIGEEKPPV